LLVHGLWNTTFLRKGVLSCRYKLSVLGCVEQGLETPKYKVKKVLGTATRYVYFDLRKWQDGIDIYVIAHF
jgi:hypothetical protein